MGVIYKILKQQRNMDINLSSSTKCKVQAAIKQRQQQKHEYLKREQYQMLDESQEQEQEKDNEEHDDHEQDKMAEQQLQQLCRFLAENAARKKRQRLKLQYHQLDLPLQQDQEQLRPLSQLPHGVNDNDMDLDLIDIDQLQHAKNPSAPRDSILLKIRHQIFERKRRRQRQLAELVQQRLVVWRPW
ncbi:uncharacterized protein Dwil_GK20002 [Drosophila willistoni]|uniref:Uncharacterized protein n=1 Tax=Drosophila willistoni TaxID=7260 RepID=B4MSM6_DROWI|nr:uncharacterized protein Dwil_GK20002 [Drosophila willistoni]